MEIFTIFGKFIIANFTLNRHFYNLNVLFSVPNLSKHEIKNHLSSWINNSIITEKYSILSDLINDDYQASSMTKQLAFLLDWALLFITMFSTVQNHRIKKGWTDRRGISNSILDVLYVLNLIPDVSQENNFTIPVTWIYHMPPKSS